MNETNASGFGYALVAGLKMYAGKKVGLTLASLLLASSSGTAVAQAVGNTSPSEAAGPVHEGAASALADAGADAPSAEQSDAPRLGDIIVTAQRRSETLQRVPASVEVVSGAQLQAAHISNLVNLQELSPSLIVAQGASPSIATFTIRGIGTSVDDVGFEQSVGVYIDGVFRGRPASALQDLVDIQQVEVLRGPQSTLFGRNNAAGAINITTASPKTDAFGVYGEATYGNYNDVQARLSVNIPILTDTLAVSLAASESYRDGYIKAPTLPRGNLNAHDRQSFRGQLLWTPTDHTRVRLIADYSKFNDRCCAYLPLFVSDAAANPPFVFPVSGDYIGLSPPTKGVRGVSPSDPSNPGTIFNPFDRVIKQDTPSVEKNSDKGVSLQVDQKFGDLTLTTIGAYRLNKSDSTVDADGTDSAVFNGQAGIDTRVAEKSLEVRIQNATGSPVEFVAGGFYFDQNVNSHYVANVTIKPISLVIPFFDTTGIQNSRSEAAFGQATYNVTSTIRVTGGLRYLHETKANIVTVVPGTFSFPGDVSRKDNALMGNAIVAYQPDQNTNFYFRYARGFKSGGINVILTLPLSVASPSVRPEKTDAFEVGAKLRMLGGKLTTNLAAYTQVVNDQQVYNFDSTTTTFITLNAAKVRSRGVEAEIAFHPIKPLTFSLNGNYLDAKYLSFSGAPAPAGSPLSTQDLTGRTTPNAPRWTLIGGISVNQPVNESLRVLGNLSVRHSTSYYTDLPLTSAFRNGNTDFVDASVELAFGNGMGLQFWGRNLTQQNAYVTGIGTPVSSGGLTGFVNEPRTYGVTLRYRH